MQTRRDRTFTMGAQAPCMRGIAIREVCGDNAARNSLWLAVFVSFLTEKVAVPRPADGVTWGFELNPITPSELKTRMLYATCYSLCFGIWTLPIVSSV